MSPAEEASNEAPQGEERSIRKKKIAFFAIMSIVVLGACFLQVRSIQRSLAAFSFDASIQNINFPNENMQGVQELSESFSKIEDFFNEGFAKIEEEDFNNKKEVDTGTATWKPYQNSKHGFSLLYPPTYAPQEILPASDASAFIVVFLDQKPQNTLFSLTPALRVNIINSPLSTQEYIQEYFGLSPASERLRQTAVQKREALQFQTTTKTEEKTVITKYTVFSREPGTLISLEYRHTENTEDLTFEETYNSFLSSFTLDSNTLESKTPTL